MHSTKYVNCPSIVNIQRVWSFSVDGGGGGGGGGLVIEEAKELIGEII